MIMARRFKKRQSNEKRPEDDDNGNSKVELIETNKRNSRLSVKDAGVILTISTIFSIILLTGTIGVSGVMERLHRNDIMDVALALVFFMSLFALLSYFLVKVAAHYVVYLAVATFCAIIFPVSPRKQQTTIRDIYDKAKK